MMSLIDMRWASFAEAHGVKMPSNVLRIMHLGIPCQHFTLPHLLVPLRLTLWSIFVLQNDLTPAHALSDLSQNFLHQVPEDLSPDHS